MLVKTSNIVVKEFLFKRSCMALGKADKMKSNLKTINACLQN